MSRIGMLLSKGKPECETLLIHPQSTAWVLFDGDENNEEINEYDKKFNNAMDELEKKHIIFHLGDEIIIEVGISSEPHRMISLSSNHHHRTLNNSFLT